MKGKRDAQRPPYVGALLRLSVMTVRKRLLAALTRHGYKGISAAHLVAFSYPFPDGVKPSELAVRGNQSKQSINHMLAELEQSGYLVRKTEKEGGRRRVYLTAKGKKVVEICQQEMIALQRDWAARVGSKAFETFLDVLRDMPPYPNGDD
ncbi:MAG TPA: MarR family transcriptional regulator [Pseudolabrys sp.]|jgi:DNA-binding MarR family transcriptional regulator|nr:MarR family transcriptional regulator [Pseudolabrys sp.]HZZ76943.1 MarR family transcriptional regulator [Gemmataceae bacterium]